MIYKYYSDTSKHAIDNFRNGKICFSHVDQFNDALEFNAKFSEEICTPQMVGTGVDLTNEQIELQKLRIRICCFSLSKYLDNMWGYYANDDRGFCLGYDEKDISFKNIILRPVVYYSNTPILTYEDAVNNVEKLFCDQVCHKKAEWIYEQELRAIMFVQPSEMEFYECEPKDLSTEEYDWNLVPPIEAFGLEAPNKHYRAVKKNFLVDCKPKELIIGKRCSNETKKELIDIANKKNIKIFLREDEV